MLHENKGRLFRRSRFGAQTLSQGKDKKFFFWIYLSIIGEQRILPSQNFSNTLSLRDKQTHERQDKREREREREKKNERD